MRTVREFPRRQRVSPTPPNDTREASNRITAAKPSDSGYALIRHSRNLVQLQTKRPGSLTETCMEGPQYPWVQLVNSEAGRMMCR